MVEGATDINLWSEWAKIEDAISKGKEYKLPKVKKGYAGIVLTLSKFQQPDLSSFDDPEVYFRVPLDYHAGLIVRSNNQERITKLLTEYAERLSNGFSTVGEQEKLKKLH